MTEVKPAPKPERKPEVETVPVRIVRKTRGYAFGKVVSVSPEAAVTLLSTGHAEDPAN